MQADETLDLKQTLLDLAYPRLGELYLDDEIVVYRVESFVYSPAWGQRLIVLHPINRAYDEASMTLGNWSYMVAQGRLRWVPAPNCWKRHAI